MRFKLGPEEKVYSMVSSNSPKKKKKKKKKKKRASPRLTLTINPSALHISLFVVFPAPLLFLFFERNVLTYVFDPQNSELNGPLLCQFLHRPIDPKYTSRKIDV